MLTIDPARALLLVIDFQARLMPAIHEGEAAMHNAARLIEAAGILGITRLVTEQNPKGLGATVAGLQLAGTRVFEKQHFDACRESGFLDLIPVDAHVVVVGCEAHVCVLQSVLGLLNAGRKVFVVRDAIGSRRAENRNAGIERMARHGAEIVTTEMALFEWLGSAQHPQFKPAVALIK